jgi:CBS domain-containing protein
MRESIKAVSVDEVVLALEQIVVLPPTELFRVAVEEMSKKRLGIACITDVNQQLIGVLTDGDIRRILLRHHKPIGALFAEDVADFMTRNPKTARVGMSLEEAVLMMEKVDVYDLPVVDEAGKLTGLLHVHSALKYFLNL